jgi:6,7-dimethyl-8-ribityllumazine synthase
MATSLHNLSDYDSGKVPSGRGCKVAIVASEWNADITNALLQGAYDTLVQYEVQPQDIKICRVPGSFELPFGAQKMIDSHHCDAVICLGCVIQGETRHFDFICSAVSQGIIDVSLKTNVPVIFGVLTTNTLQQAHDRAGGKHGNKGIEAAVTALKMMNLD